MIFQNDDKVRIQDISYSSSVDGEGFRDVLFVNYCPHHCKGCHNPETWDESHGTWKSLQEVYDKLTMSNITDVTFSGGEPFCQPGPLAKLARALTTQAKKTVWSYSGYLYEDILANPDKRELLECIDVLVDGPFVEDLKKENLRFLGSTNQRIIDVKKSLKTGNVVMWQEDW